MSRALTPNILTPQDLEPNWTWEGRLPAWGHTNVDFERRVDHDRLRRYRLARTHQALKASDCGTLLLFDVNNIRYVSATKIGEWERDKMCRFALLTGDDAPYVWDFGSAAVHHKKYSDWLVPDHCRAGVVGMRGTIPPSFRSDEEIRRGDRGPDRGRGHEGDAGRRRLCRDGDVPCACRRRASTSSMASRSC